ncbi:MAG: hypothetical protein IJR19_03920 [Lachnospiraceae bacterium]|nr:hypothetical protein [Lachnospiraceae bacterium]MBQ7260486.1 hypothetical protein [Lachnospiraceae bacterium]
MIGRKKYSMDLKSANDILQNVLKENNKEPNTVPFDRLVFSNTVNVAFAKTGRIASLCLLVLIALSPLAFKDNGFSVRNSGLIEKIIVSDHQLYSDHFVMYLKGSNIDYDNIYARKPDGTFVFPTSVDEETGEVTFPYEGLSLNIYIPDLNGKVLQAILSAE